MWSAALPGRVREHVLSYLEILAPAGLGLLLKAHPRVSRSRMFGAVPGAEVRLLVKPACLLRREHAVEWAAALPIFAGPIREWRDAHSGCFLEWWVRHAATLARVTEHLVSQLAPNQVQLSAAENLARLPDVVGSGTSTTAASCRARVHDSACAPPTSLGSQRRTSPARVASWLLPCVAKGRLT